MSAYYVDKKHPERGYYQFWQHSKTGEWRWSWTEGSSDEVSEEVSEWFSHLVWAMRNAALDWESNGDGSNPRLAGMLRGLAAKVEKRESNV